MKSTFVVMVLTLFLVLAMTPTAQAGKGHFECSITAGSAAGQMFGFQAVRIGGCFLLAIPEDSNDITLHTPPGCTIFYDEDANQSMDGEVTDRVAQFWDLYGYCDLPNIGSTIGITVRW